MTFHQSGIGGNDECGVSDSSDLVGPEGASPYGIVNRHERIIWSAFVRALARLVCMLKSRTETTRRHKYARTHWTNQFRRITENFQCSSPSSRPLLPCNVCLRCDMELKRGMGIRKGEGKGSEEGKIGESFIVRLIRQKRIDC